MTSNSNPRMQIAYPLQLRMSLGTAIALGLAKAKLQVHPTTAYLMTYNPNKCSANCSFCSQAREARGSASMLSRVSWPVFRTGIAIKAINESFRKNETKRVCVQALNYPKVFNHVVSVVTRIRNRCEIPISVYPRRVHYAEVRPHGWNQDDFFSREGATDDLCLLGSEA